MKNSKILYKLLRYFAAALLVFSLVTGAIFIPLLRSQSINDYKSYMDAQATSIASALAQYLTGTTEDAGNLSSGLGSGSGFGFGSGGDPSINSGGGTGGVGAYLRFVDQVAMADVWVVDQKMSLIVGNNQQSEVVYKDLPEDANEVVQQAFLGTTTFSEGFSDLLDTPTITVGTPIQSEGETLGVVLLHSPVAGMQETTWKSLGLLAVSTLIALLFSAFLAIYLATSFTRPLDRIKKSALQLADGEYGARTELTLPGEIGDLAKAVDELGVKLGLAKQESEKLDKLRQDFVANISHELNTPVTVLRGSLEALQDGVVTNPNQVKEYHQNMLKESISLQRLVGDLLELSRLQNTDFSMEMQSFDGCDALKDAQRSASRLAQEKNITLHYVSDVDGFPMVGDYGRIRQMFLIILDNAIKFSAPDTSVVIELNQGVVSISDRGVGISAADLPHVFDRFYRAKSPDNTNGSGLGLAIAKQIADRHGITVSVQSNPGVGTRFAFNFSSAIR